jgi:membrane-associated phospholipid phosphatase
VNEPQKPTAERVWITYIACIVTVALFAPGAGPGYDARRTVLVHLGLFVCVLGSRWLAVHRGPGAARLARSVLAVVGLPCVFSSLCWLLPGVHPEPYELSFCAIDRAVFGGDAGRFVDHLPGVCVDVLQLVYTSFYFLCILAVLLAGRGSGRAAFDRASLALVVGFLASYLGYLLVPTCAPKVLLAFEHEITGAWLTPALRTSVDGAEVNPWDCFPSGHTMLTVTSLLIVWRWHRRWFRWFLAPCLLLIASTVLLRYHWTIDVVVGALLAWPVMRFCDRLADADGWPELLTCVQVSRLHPEDPGR